MSASDYEKPRKTSVTTPRNSSETRTMEVWSVATAVMSVPALVSIEGGTIQLQVFCCREHCISAVIASDGETDQLIILGKKQVRGMYRFRQGSNFWTPENNNRVACSSRIYKEVQYRLVVCRHYDFLWRTTQATRKLKTAAFWDLAMTRRPITETALLKRGTISIRLRGVRSRGQTKCKQEVVSEWARDALNFSTDYSCNSLS